MDLQTVVEAGDPPHTIRDYLDRIETDHVTIGSHSRDEDTHVLLRIVTQFIVRRASFPVTVVR